MSYLSPIAKSLTKIRNRYSRSPVTQSSTEEEETEYEFDAEVAQINSTSLVIDTSPSPSYIPPPPSLRKATPGPSSREERAHDPSPPPRFFIR